MSPDVSSFEPDYRKMTEAEKLGFRAPSVVETIVENHPSTAETMADDRLENEQLTIPFSEEDIKEIAQEPEASIETDSQPQNSVTQEIIEAKVAAEKRNNKALKRTTAIAAAAGLAIGAWFGRGAFDHTKSPKVIAVATPSESPRPSLGASERKKNFDKDLKKDMPGFKPGQILVGDQVDFSKNLQSDRGSDTFGDRTINSISDLKSFLSSKDKRAVAAEQEIEAALKSQPDELKRALSGEGYIPVQFTVPIEIKGTTYYVAGKVIQINGNRPAEKGDVFWLFVDKEGHIIPGASLRADCHNPHFTIITPKTPVPLPGPDQQKGSGGQPEQGMDPQNDSNTDGYGPGDTKPTPTPSPTPSAVPTGPETSPSANPTDSPNPSQTPPPPSN